MARQSKTLGVISLLFTLLTAVYHLVGLIGGAWLLSLGDSPYYVVTGVVLLVFAWLLWRLRASAFVF